jgi:hypothetical protein
LIGEMVWVSEPPNSARFRIRETIKGEVSKNEINLRLKDTGRLVISCQAWRMLRNVYLHQGEEFIVYVSDGSLLRTGLTERTEFDIGLDREVSIVRRASSNT